MTPKAIGDAMLSILFSGEDARDLGFAGAEVLSDHPSVMALGPTLHDIAGGDAGEAAVSHRVSP